MKKTVFLLLIALSVGLISCYRIRGSGHIISESRDVRDFDRLSLAIPAAMHITQGSKESLTIEADDNILREIITEVHGKELVIRFRHRNFTNKIRPSKTIHCTLTVIRLDEGSIEGSGSINCPHLSAENLNMIISGSGSVRLDTLIAERFHSTINGSGSFTIAGTCPNQDISIYGSGRVEARDLQSQSVDIMITGLGRTIVNATDHLDISITGRGDVRYAGNPEITKSITGSGSVRQIQID